MWKSHYTHAPDRALPATARSVRCVNRSYHRDASHAAPLHGELYLQRCYSLFKVPEEKNSLHLSPENTVKSFHNPRKKIGCKAFALQPFVMLFVQSSILLIYFPSLFNPRSMLFVMAGRSVPSASAISLFFMPRK